MAEKNGERGSERESERERETVKNKERKKERNTRANFQWIIFRLTCDIKCRQAAFPFMLHYVCSLYRNKIEFHETQHVIYTQ